MKKMTMNAAGVILGLGMLVPQVRANSVVLTQDAYSYQVGGEFNAVTSPDNFLPYYSPLAVVGNGFQTFCIETTVEFSPGSTYSYTLSSSDSQGRDLTQGAAFLYAEFGRGILPNYDYADAAARNSDAAALQAAIWWFQGEQTWGGFPSPTDNIYYEFAIKTLGLAQADSANNGRFGVDVLELWSGDSAAQDQLVLVPDHGATLLLLGGSLSALAVMRPRRKACPVEIF
jgi:hypothetical protein